MTGKVRVLGCWEGEKGGKRQNSPLTAGMSSVLREEKMRAAVEKRIKKKEEVKGGVKCSNVFT